MTDQKPLTNDEGEVRELSETDFAKFVSFSELPADLQQVLLSPARLSNDSTDSTKQQSAA